MSLAKNRLILRWKEVEAQLRSTGSLTLAGHQLSTQDRARIANAYVLWALVLIDLYGIDETSRRQYSFTNMSRWVYCLASLDCAEVLSATKDLLALLRDFDPYQGYGGVGSFKHYLEDVGFDCYNPALWPILLPCRQWDGDVAGFWKLNISLQFIQRLTLHDIDWIEDENLQSYLDFEETLSHLSYPEAIIQELQLLSAEDACDYGPGFQPEHSGGATATCKRGCGEELKWRRMVCDWGGLQLCHRYNFSHSLLDFCPVEANCGPCRVALVPKGLDKKRVISFEPTFHQYLQHGVFHAMDTWFHKHPEFRITLQNQDRNRRMALEGSRYRNYGTIDLSNASDSVTLSLVKRIVPMRLLSDLIRCRTGSAILPDGTQIRLEKFSPMGSAVCFPLECYVFSLICRLACKRKGVAENHFSVYGDDIIASEVIFDEVISLLAELNFSVNYDKTFAPYDSFKESCGIEAYLGYDVSPCRIPRNWDIAAVRGHRPTALSGATSLANRLAHFGLASCRQYVVREILDYFPGTQFSFNSEYACYSETPTNFHLRSRGYNSHGPSLQVPEVRSQMLVATDSPGSDDIRYQIVLERMSHTQRTHLLLPDDRIEVSVGPSRAKLVTAWRWDPGYTAAWKLQD